MYCATGGTNMNQRTPACGGTLRRDGIAWAGTRTLANGEEGAEGRSGFVIVIRT